jgi:hypothetical protein
MGRISLPPERPSPSPSAALSSLIPLPPTLTRISTTLSSSFFKVAAAWLASASLPRSSASEEEASATSLSLDCLASSSWPLSSLALAASASSCAIRDSKFERSAWSRRTDPVSSGHSLHGGGGCFSLSAASLRWVSLSRASSRCSEDTSCTNLHRRGGMHACMHAGSGAQCGRGGPVHATCSTPFLLFPRSLL